MIHSLKKEVNEERRQKFAPILSRSRAIVDNFREKDEKGFYFWFRQLNSGSTPRTTVEGKEMVLLGSNSYLGLTTHPRVVAAARAALEKYGFGSGSARFLTGTTEAHVELEEKLAWFKGDEACLLYSTGYMANLGLVTSIVGPGDVVFLDSLDHASIIDAAKMSGAKMRIYKHNDMADLERKLHSVGQDQVCLVITDGVFSMDGDVADLPGLVELSKRYGFFLMVDDAHGTGVLGKGGRGTCEHFNLKNHIDLNMGTLSKSLASIGGYITGDRDYIYHLRHTSRPFIFDTSLPPAACAASSAAIDVIVEEPEILTSMRDNAEYLRNGLQSLGYNTLSSKGTPIIPVLIGDENKLMAITHYLFEHGILVCGIFWPACHRDASRLRISVMATHTRKDLDYALNVMADIYQKFYIRDSNETMQEKDSTGLNVACGA